MFGLTSNALDRVHAPQILETLAKYKIRLAGVLFPRSVPGKSKMAVSFGGLCCLNSQGGTKHAHTMGRNGAFQSPEGI